MLQLDSLINTFFWTTENKINGSSLGVFQPYYKTYLYSYNEIQL